MRFISTQTLLYAWKPLLIKLNKEPFFWLSEHTLATCRDTGFWPKNNPSKEIKLFSLTIYWSSLSFRSRSLHFLYLQAPFDLSLNNSPRGFVIRNAPKRILYAIYMSQSDGYVCKCMIKRIILIFWDCFPELKEAFKVCSRRQK